MSRFVHYIGLFFLSCSFAQGGESLGISPAIVLIDNVQPGTVIDLGAKGLKYAVHNQGGPEQEFVFEVVAPPTYSLKAFEAGFEPLPDASWLTLDEATVIAAANGKAESGVTLHIPDAPEHWNRHYVVYIEAGVGKKVALGATLKVRARLLIETAVQADGAAALTSEIAVSPGRIDMANSPGEGWSGTANVHNKGPTAVFDVLTMQSVYPDSMAERRGRFYPGYVQALENEELVIVDLHSFTLEKDQKRNLHFSSPGSVVPGNKPIDVIRFIGRRAAEGATDIRMAGDQAYDRIELLRIRHPITKK